ncbi:MAG: hypothetical protein KAJ46_07650 [Sedimentisphaerales bacterium]|nr:hypothetical protein [Sedimentisphaerales bacterium]
MGLRKLFAKKSCHYCLLLAIALSIFPTSAGGQQSIKVHKPFISVSSPNDEGVVTVVGRSGAVEYIGSATVQLIRLSDNYKIPVTLGEEGSFEAKISAKAGEKIRVSARSQEGRRSYGTFTVPAGAPPGPTRQHSNDEISVTDQPVDQPQPVSSVSLSTLEPMASDTDRLPRKPSEKLKNETVELAVIITVVNINSGRIVAARRIAGPTRARPEQTNLFNAVVKNIIDKCTAVAMAEFRRRTGSSKKKSPEKCLSTDITTQKTKDKSPPEANSQLTTYLFNSP